MHTQRTEAMLIDGVWCAASDGAVVEVENPSNRTIVATVPKATASDLATALAAAERVRGEWRDTGAWQRSEVLRRAASLIRERVDEIAGLLTEEQAKTLAEARGEVHSAAEQFDWYADEARRIYGRTLRVISGFEDLCLLARMRTPRMRCLFVRPALCLQLPSDPGSPRAPLLFG